MKNALQIAPYVAIIAILVYFTQCQKQSQPETVTIHDTINSIDSFPVEGKTVYYPSPYEVIKYDTTFKDVDTLKIIQNYLTENKYKFNISDSTGNIDVLLSVQYNTLKNYTWKGYFKTYTKTINNVEYISTPKRNNVVAGLILSGNKDYFGAIPILGLKTKKENTFLVGYDVVNMNYMVGYLFKMGRK